MRNPKAQMFAEACAMLKQAEQLHRQFFGPSSDASIACWEPPVDVFETEREVIVITALPGVRPEAVRAEIGAISRPAVYDALGLLTERRLIRRIQPAGSPALYEHRVGDNHHHVSCRTCGEAADVDCAVGEAPCLTASVDSGYRIDEAEVIFWGTCPDCLAKTPGTED